MRSGTKARRRLPTAAVTAALLSAAVFFGARQTARSLPEKPPAASASLAREIASVLPKPAEERWLWISWRTNLMQARAEAQRANKPLLLWVMDGNPLGCT